MLDDSLLPMAEMVDFEAPAYSKKQVVRAGKLLCQRIDWLDDGVREAFHIAHNWRSSYAYPMHRIRHELRGKVSRAGGIGVTAARLKRMISIRRKLTDGPITLYQMQDIAGVRAVLPEMADVNRLTELMTADTRHSVLKIDDYLNQPKPDGYRCRHVILKYVGDGEDKIYNRQFVEVQLRTRLQHSWATAVESVGLVTGENLKNGQGNSDWLRFFALMSAELAEREGLPSGDWAPEKKHRIAELRELNSKLDAISELESYRDAIRYTDEVFTGQYRYVLMKFEPENRRVTVEPHIGFREIDDEYGRLEWFNSVSESLTNAVLVEVDRINDLRAAYPNYFLDVEAFARVCRDSILSPSEDFSWITSWRKRGGKSPS